MDIKSVKDYLNQLRFLDKVINQILAEIYELRISATSIGAIQNKEKVQTSPNYDKIGSIVAKIADMEKQVDELVDKRADLRHKIQKTILRMEKERHREILWMKYIDGKSIYQIADELEMQPRGCKKAHNKALEEFGKNYENHNI